MRKLILLINFFLLSFCIHSQDLIVTTNGDSISCKILKVINNKIYFSYYENYQTKNTLLLLNQVADYKYKVFEKTVNQEIPYAEDAYKFVEKAGGHVFNTQTGNGGISKSDTIEINKKWYGSKFFQDDKILNFSELSNILKQAPESGSLMKKAEVFHIMGLVFASSGGALIGWPVGTALGGGEPNWKLAGIGGGLVVFSFIFGSISTEYIAQSVNIYNSNSHTSSKVNVQVGMLNKGFGIRISF